MIDMLTRMLNTIHKNTQGFTLIEILVSLTILTLALPPLLRAFSQAGNQSSNSEAETTAVNLLKYKMAEMEMLGYPETTGQEEGEFGEGSRYQWSSEVQDTDTEGLRLISVTILWQEQGRQRTMTMNTYMADRKYPQEQATQQQQQGGGNR